METTTRRACLNCTVGTGRVCPSSGSYHKEHATVPSYTRPNRAWLSCDNRYRRRRSSNTVLPRTDSVTYERRPAASNMHEHGRGVGDPPRREAPPPRGVGDPPRRQAPPPRLRPAPRLTREDYLNRGDIRREEISVTGNPTRILSAIITSRIKTNELRRIWEDLGTPMPRGGGYPQRRRITCLQCGHQVAGSFLAHAVRGCDYSLVNPQAERVALRAMAVAREAAENAPNNREHIAALHADAVHGHQESHRQLGELRGQIGALASRLEAREEEAAATEGREKKSADAEEAAASVAPPRQGAGVGAGDMPTCVICMGACPLNTASCTNCSKRMCDECLVSRSADQVLAEGNCSTRVPVRLRCPHCREMAVEIPENGTVTARDYMMGVAMAVGQQDGRNEEGGTGVGSSRPLLG